MYNRFLALLWLRTQVIMTNKNILLPVLMPYFMLLLFKFVMKTDDTKAMDLMGICFSMAIGMSVGSPISAMISEEKEKPDTHLNLPLIENSSKHGSDLVANKPEEGEKASERLHVTFKIPVWLIALIVVMIVINIIVLVVLNR